MQMALYPSIPTLSTAFLEVPQSVQIPFKISNGDIQRMVIDLLPALRLADLLLIMS